MGMRKRGAILAVALSVCAATIGDLRSARADQPAPTADNAAEADPKIAEARQAFDEGSALVTKGDWAEALSAFERSMELRPHPVTRYNIAIAERALGQYTRAQASLRAAMASSGAETLPSPLVDQANVFLGEIDQLLGSLTLTVAPQGAVIAVDGRPLDPVEGASAGKARFIAGTLAPGVGTAITGGGLEILLDPGVHVIVFKRKGFSEVALNRTIKPGAASTENIQLDQLPASIRVTASQPKARVTVDGVDVGFAPVDVSRPPGSYKVEVSKDGRVPFSTKITLEPGADAKLNAPLPARSKTVLERWWFWTGASVLVTGVAVGTYFAVRPKPQRPAVNGGTLGWAIDLR